MKRISILSLLLMSILVFAACQPVAMPAEEMAEEPAAEEASEEVAGEASEEMADEEMAEEMGDIVETAIAAGGFETLVAAVQAAGLVETLQGEGPFTVFAPTDEAFASLPAGTVESLLEDPEGALTDILLYHVVAGKVMAADVVGMESSSMVETAGGNAFMLTVADGNVMVDGANVVATDIETSNGVIHVIDAVIIPASDEEMSEEPADEEMADEADDEEMADEDDDEADDEEMADEDDDEADDEEMAEEMGDIVATAIGAGGFETLVAAVEAAGLVETLQGEGPFTVFAPTDDAFAALPEGTVDTLLADPEGALTDILLYHVVVGKVMAADVVGMESGSMVETAGGNAFTLTIEDGNVMVDGANVVATDIETSNGVIHVIDAVIVPASE